MKPMSGNKIIRKALVELISFIIKMKCKAHTTIDMNDFWCWKLLCLYDYEEILPTFTINYKSFKHSQNVRKHKALFIMPKSLFSEGNCSKACSSTAWVW